MNLVGRIATIVAAGVATATVITGCTPGRSAVPPRPVATPMLSSVSQAQLPIASYELTEQQMAQVQYLSQRLRQRCMRDFGFDFLPELSTASIAQTVRIAQEFDSRWYGVSDETAARTYGYHMPTWVNGTAAPKLIAKLPTAERGVFEGSASTYDNRAIPRGGCVGAAAEQLAQAGIGADTQRSDGSDPGTLVGNIRRNDFNRAQSDPRVLAVFAKWSACMDSHGYHYNSPFTAVADPRWATTVTTPSALEIQTAEADIACKLRVNLLGIEYTVIADHQNADIAKNAQILATAKTQITQQSEALQHLMTRYAS
jgi:hypothetical protein